MIKLRPSNLRNLIFGAEDSLVSTMGLLFGISSISGYTRTQIFITGIIAVSVEALSMGAGAFLSEDTVKVDSDEKERPLVDGIIMFFSYIIAGFVPLLPFLLLEVATARYVAILTTLCALYVLGYIPSKSKKRALKMVVIAGIAAFLGFTVAYIFKL